MSFDFSPKGMMAVEHLRFKRLWLGLGLLMVAIVTLGSVISIPPTIKAFMLQDKVLHTLAYACLMAWFAQIYRHDLTRLLLVIALTGMGIGIEFIQGMVPHRQFDLLDMIANTSGVVLAWALAYTWVGNVLCWMEGLFCRKILGIGA
ncbi:MAG: VanZ family protein [Granulosicoccus sp.]